MINEADIIKIIRKERDKKRTIHIEISNLDGSDYAKLRDNLKKNVLKLVRGIPCTMGIKDDEGTPITDINIEW